MIFIIQSISFPHVIERYWSSSQNSNNNNNAWLVDFSDGNVNNNNKNNNNRVCCLAGFYTGAWSCLKGNKKLVAAHKTTFASLGQLLFIKRIDWMELSIEEVFEAYYECRKAKRYSKSALKTSYDCMSNWKTEHGSRENRSALSSQNLSGERFLPLRFETELCIIF